MAIGYIHPLIPKRNLDGNKLKGKSAIKLSMKLNMTSVRELVVLHSTPSMFDRFLVQCLEVVGRFEQQTFYIVSLRVERILACQRGAKVHANSDTTSKHPPQEERIIDIVLGTTS